jgi:cobalt-precorrin-5B (C1)-methyltransferase
MIRKAVFEALAEERWGGTEGTIEVVISVADGETLAQKTLNPRLGIIGGISILGTTGIVKPLSTEAWTATITASMDVARAAGLDEVVISAGRVSERAHMEQFRFPEEAYVMMGDYLEFSLRDASRHRFGKIHLCSQWAKLLKIALSTPQTHVRHGALDVQAGVGFLNGLGIAVPSEREFNTAREIFDYLTAGQAPALPLFRKVCVAAQRYAETIAGGTPVVSHLVSYGGRIMVSSE